VSKRLTPASKQMSMRRGNSPTSVWLQALKPICAPECGRTEPDRGNLESGTSKRSIFIAALDAETRLRMQLNTTV
jgi:hypothetical protein